MQQINVLRLEDINKIVSKIPAEKLVFWIGAGIDSGKPTGLPLGNGLTDYVLQLTCGKNKQRLIDSWTERCNLFNTIIQEGFLPNRPRLETIIEVVKKFEEYQINKQSILEGLRAFSSKHLTYNTEHLLLAQYLHMGANIVTTNYGDFICKAYEDLYGEGLISHENQNIHLYKLKNKWSSCIFHIHGISSDLNTIGANLAAVKNSLPNSFKQVFESWINNGHVIIYMGYSGLDSMDVNPFLQSYNSTQGSTGIFVRHSLQNGGTLSLPSEREKILLQAFENKYVCPCITSDFFKILNNYNKTKTFTETANSKDWRDVFIEYTEGYDEDSSNTFLLGLCYLLGIPITNFFSSKEWIAMVFKSSNVDNWYKSFYSFENAVMIGQQSIVKEQGGRLTKDSNDELMKREFEHAQRNTEKDKKPPTKEMLDSIKKAINNKQVIIWDISTALNRYVEYVFLSIVKNIIIKRNGNLTKKHKEGVNVAKECLETIISGNYDSIIDVNQMNTAMRSLSICRSILGAEINDILAELDTVIKNYADVSSINGIAKTMLFQALVCLMDYCKLKNNQSLKSAKFFLKRASKIIHKCGLKKYYRYCRYAQVWRLMLLIGI